MARIKLILPETFIFSTDLEIRITDLNYGNHLGNDSMLSLIHEARIRFLHSLGFSETNIDGYGILMADAAIIYKAQVFYDDSVTIEIAVSDLGKRSCDMYYRISKGNGKIAALAKTAIVFYDYKTEKPVRIPEPFLQSIEKVHTS